MKAKDDYKENVCFATILALQDTKSSIGDKHHSDDCQTRGAQVSDLWGTKVHFVDINNYSPCLMIFKS
ncbi:hypothetical protein [Prevotella nigrescens]|uniref:hypothetical protein n=1 Tax=Prevotella nigrescens TaxID=28133 RepID=UPI001BA69110|nr:hypothetical protein [Prevotella nigrescens]QUB52802.1 hypothetical protein J5A59_06945 [Prevotella nigrescens]